MLLDWTPLTKEDKRKSILEFHHHIDGLIFKWQYIQRVHRPKNQARRVVSKWHCELEYCFCGIRFEDHLRCQECEILVGPPHWETYTEAYKGKQICQTCFNWHTTVAVKEAKGKCPRCGGFTYEDGEPTCMQCGWRPTTEHEEPETQPMYHGNGRTVRLN